MNSSSGDCLRIVLYEGSGSQPLAGDERYRLLKTLLDKGYGVTCTGRQGHLAGGGKDAFAPKQSPTGLAQLVLGRYEGGKPTQAGEDDDFGLVRFQDIQGLEATRVVDAVEVAASEIEAKKPGGWKPWFPVIDYERCTNCMQCLSFCLFDVYSSSPEGKIQVQNPHKCKTDCPACSRVCPEVAILFPKYRAGPINGDVVSDEDLQREKMKIDISALLGGDIYALLRERSQRAQTRFAKERDDQRALEERQRCLVKLQKEVDIPPEVLMSLPSPDEIRFRAERAKAAAQEALSRQAEVRRTTHVTTTEG
ncbi:MAG: ferredoxin family protein [Acidobacteria bacterium]|nr:ferredoxin family protein [Acidobacteriota bacterium]